MYSSLAWIEWLDRLDRVLQSARSDLAGFARSGSARRLAALERSRRQLIALTNELRLLDRSVLAGDSAAATTDLAADLKTALDTALLRLGGLSSGAAAGAAPERQRLNAVDAALRDCCYEAAALLEPRRRRA